MIGEVSSAFGLGGEPTLVKELTEGSKKLAEIVHQYMMWVSTFAVEVTQFFETQQTNYGARFGVRVNRMVRFRVDFDAVSLNIDRSFQKRALVSQVTQQSHCLAITSNWQSTVDQTTRLI